jgi:valyl-tRNA synthetase
VLAPWPQHEGLDDPEAEAELGWVIDLVTAIRSVRTEMNVPPAAQVPLLLLDPEAETRVRIERWEEFIKRLARVSEVTVADAVPRNAVQLVVRGDAVALPLGGIIDVAAEQARLEKEMAKVSSDIARVDAKLGNADFLKRAPEEVVEGERDKREEAEARRAKIIEALERLKGAA